MTTSYVKIHVFLTNLVALNSNLASNLGYQFLFVFYRMLAIPKFEIARFYEKIAELATVITSFVLGHGFLTNLDALNSNRETKLGYHVLFIYWTCKNLKSLDFTRKWLNWKKLSRISGQKHAGRLLLDSNAWNWTNKIQTTFK